MDFEAAARAMQVYEDHATPVEILASLSQQVLLFIYDCSLLKDLV